jgi:hypothetical protein
MTSAAANELAAAGEANLCIALHNIPSTWTSVRRMTSVGFVGPGICLTTMAEHTVTETVRAVALETDVLGEASHPPRVTVVPIAIVSMARAETCVTAIVQGTVVETAVVKTTLTAQIQTDVDGIVSTKDVIALVIALATVEIAVVAVTLVTLAILVDAARRLLTKKIRTIVMSVQYLCNRLLSRVAAANYRSFLNRSELSLMLRL